MGITMIKSNFSSPTVGVIGLGYVGLPLVMEAVAHGFQTIGFDIDNSKVDSILAGKTYLKHIPDSAVKKLADSGRFTPTTDFSRLRDIHCIIICVPTPLTAQREPDLSYITSTADSIYPHLQKGQIVVLESTTYPGTTDEVLLPLLEKSGLKCGEDFYPRLLAGAGRSWQQEFHHQPNSESSRWI